MHKCHVSDVFALGGGVLPNEDCAWVNMLLDLVLNLQHCENNKACLPVTMICCKSKARVQAVLLQPPLCCSNHQGDDIGLHACIWTLALQSIAHHLVSLLHNTLLTRLFPATEIVRTLSHLAEQPRQLGLLRRN